ncbi:hypothetical protein [Chachezhania sediminis]|uniref:hypothetical protein n=1 Tax=Chachezhania sediminis TaxID=2599291 RepID=UPI00131C2FE6|nr:hypothetical protein [Chachezhania sediminis]
MRPGPVALICLLSAMAAGCSSLSNKEPILFEGKQFRAKAKGTSKESLSPFRVEVKNPSQSLEGARQAGIYEGTRYCIEKFGTSQIVWENNANSPEAQPKIVDGKLVVSGQCDP